MAENSLIAWTHHTFNPWIGCVKVSDGCKNCYAETLVVNRMGKPGLWGPAKTTHRQRTSAANWQKVRRLHKDAVKREMADRNFIASLADVFEDHPDANAARPDVFGLIRETPYFSHLLCTKRPENVADMLPADWGKDGYPNVWLLTSVENMKVAHRVEQLAKVPAVVHGISYEPALGPLYDLSIEELDWIIYGGESGPGFRAHDLAWPRGMRVKCLASRHAKRQGRQTAFFYKQSAAPRTEMGIQLDGEIVRNYPKPRSLDWNAGQLARFPWFTRAALLAHQARYNNDMTGGSAPPTDPRAAERAALPLFEG